jgi:hypothetical protein
MRDDEWKLSMGDSHKRARGWTLRGSSGLKRVCENQVGVAGDAQRIFPG